MTKKVDNDDLRRLHQWQHKNFRVFSAAVVLIFLGITLPLAIDLPQWFQPLLFLLGFILLVVVVIFQLSAKCPNCGARLGIQVLPILPDQCKSCGLQFPRLHSLDSELDN